jgi:3-deoxy-7-phosphoheptulonate synthase
MIIVLKPGITEAEETRVLHEIEARGYTPHVMRGVSRVVIGAIGDAQAHQSLETLASWSQVESVTRIQKRYKLVSKEGQKEKSTVRINDRVQIGGRKVQLMADPALSK